MSQAVFYLFSFILLLSGVMVTISRNPVHSVLYLILAFFNAAGLFILLGAELLAMLLVIVYVGAVAVLFLFVVMMIDIVPSSEPARYIWPQVVQSAQLFLKFTLYFLGFLLLAGLLEYLLVLTIQMMAGKIVLMQQLLNHNEGHIIYKKGICVVLAYLILKYAFKKSLWKIGYNFFQSVPLGGLLGLVILAEISYILAHQKPLNLSTSFVSQSFLESQNITNTKALGKILYTDYIMLFEVAGMILLLAMIGAIVLTHRTREGVKRQNIKDQISRRKEDTLELHDLPIGKGIS